MERANLLHNYVKDIPWECFEAVHDGTIKIYNIDFFMRVGKHLTMPMQVIFAEDMFVRTRKWIGNEVFTPVLKQLNAKDTKNALYDRSYPPHALSLDTKWWKPDYPYGAYQQNAGIAQTQITSQGTVYLAGLGSYVNYPGNSIQSSTNLPNPNPSSSGAFLNALGWKR